MYRCNVVGGKRIRKHHNPSAPTNSICQYFNAGIARNEVWVQYHQFARAVSKIGPQGGAQVCAEIVRRRNDLGRLIDKNLCRAYCHRQGLGTQMFKKSRLFEAFDVGTISLTLSIIMELTPGGWQINAGGQLLSKRLNTV